MKRKISFILAVIMLVSLFTGVVSAADLPAGKILADTSIINTGFDASRNPGFGDWDAESTVTWDNSVGHNAAGSLKYVSTTATNYFCFWSSPQVKANTDYLVSYWVKSETAGASIALQVNDGSIMSAKWYSTTSTEWEQVSFIMNLPTEAPNTVNGYSLHLFTDGWAGTLHVDDFSITEIVDDPNYVPTYEKISDENGGYVILQDNGADADTYTSFYFKNVNFEEKEYTMSVKMMANSASSLVFDLEDKGDVEDKALEIADSELKTWVEKTVTFTPAEGSYPARIYWFPDNTDKMVLIKEWVIKDGEGNVVAEFTGKVQPTDPPHIGASFSWVEPKAAEGGDPAPAPKLTNILELETVKSHDYMLFENSASAPNAGYYMRAKLNKGEEYTLTFDVLSNNSDVEILTDLEFPVEVTGVSTQGGKVSAVDKWETVSYKITTNAKWEDCTLGDGQSAVHGWPLRIYTAGAMDAQTAIDNIVVKDSKGNVVLSQDFKESTLGDIPTWGIGKYTHIPLGFVPEQEGEVLGYNELVNGNFEDSSLMSYWWFRTDWNGGTWKAEAGKGYDGSVGLVAYGKGAGAADQNNGCFYTLYGEGKEATLDLIEGKTYVLKYKVFRPEGVDSYTYIDINEGAVTNGTATANGEWETVTARFVAPAGALKIRLVVNALAEGEYVVFDDIELRQVGGDPNGNPKTDDNMNLGFVVAVMAISVAGVVIVSKKRVLSK